MAKIIGIKPTVFNFTDKNGHAVHSEGVTFFVAYPQKDTDGFACDKFYLSHSKMTSVPSVGDEIEIYYNRFGKVNGLKVLS